MRNNEVLDRLQNLIGYMPQQKELVLMTGIKPAVAIIVNKSTDRHYIERIKKVDKNIKIFVIKAKNYKSQ